mmetsp:Transcript_20879/g.52758  ORF Transcript_20879/g.52758 Transcript_20879/m.52758 type:complete len:481 (-) Transcript_20879:294-1736(-)|eukprot:CAMPEP_0178999234 /NCGR_PEP_ID=MMETSP0795-20121207/9938_1 /TAXON_ID=88552 /ORGANISM="Amoebophrya sp., Strain Ameob2" /LENGTH=480 /DNA_ID=CAMNT_0020691967 /DNA_START=260 /DNA_END=1702 /DNA_ORIENTATION=+
MKGKRSAALIDCYEQQNWVTLEQPPETSTRSGGTPSPSRREAEGSTTVSDDVDVSIEYEGLDWVTLGLAANVDSKSSSKSKHSTSKSTTASPDDGVSPCSASSSELDDENDEDADDANMPTKPKRKDKNEKRLSSSTLTLAGASTRSASSVARRHERDEGSGDEEDASSSSGEDDEDEDENAEYFFIGEEAEFFDLCGGDEDEDEYETDMSSSGGEEEDGDDGLGDPGVERSPEELQRLEAERAARAEAKRLKNREKRRRAKLIWVPKNSLPEESFVLLEDVVKKNDVLGGGSGREEVASRNSRARKGHKSAGGQPSQLSAAPSRSTAGSEQQQRQPRKIWLTKAEVDDLRRKLLSRHQAESANGGGRDHASMLMRSSSGQQQKQAVRPPIKIFKVTKSKSGKKKPPVAVQLRFDRLSEEKVGAASKEERRPKRPSPAAPEDAANTGRAAAKSSVGEKPQKFKKPKGSKLWVVKASQMLE